MGVSPDGYAYWEGATSLWHGRGFTYFGGDPIFAFLPLYSIWLLIWISLLGPQAWVLWTSNVVLLMATGFFWTRLAALLFDSPNNPVKAFALSGVAVFIPLFFAYNISSRIRAETLSVFLLGLLLIAMLDEKERYSHAKAVLRWFLLLLLLHCKNSNLAFVFGYGVWSLVKWQRQRPIVWEMLGIAVVLGSWYLTRVLLGQGGSHPVGLGAGQYSFDAYVFQIVNHFGLHSLPHVPGYPELALLTPLVGTALLAPFLYGLQDGEPARSFSIFATSSLVGLLVLFNLTWVGAELSFRFTYFAFLSSFILLLFYGLRAKSSKWWVAALLLVFLIPGMTRLAIYSLGFKKFTFSHGYTVSWSAALHPDIYDGSGAFFRQPMPASHEQLSQAGLEGNYINPPNYRWIDRGGGGSSDPGGL